MRSFLALALPLAAATATATAATAAAAADECVVSDSDKFDCGFVGINATGCANKGCCWSESSADGVPWCFYPAGAVSTCFALADTAQEPFSASEVTTMRDLFLANVNIEGKGGVVAAPDYNTPGGSYYYHWERDGALTMRALQETANSTMDVAAYMQSYVSWVLNVQAEADPNGIDVRTEPKYYLPGAATCTACSQDMSLSASTSDLCPPSPVRYLRSRMCCACATLHLSHRNALTAPYFADGEVFDQGWCRPQNDGPGLRAISVRARCVFFWHAHDA